MPETETDETRPDRRSVLLVGLGILVTGGLAYREIWLAPDYAGKAFSVSEAYDLASAGHILLIDIRRPDEWRDTGLPQGALPIDMRSDDFTAALIKAAGTDMTKPIALICARGVRSARLANRLSQAGFINVVDVPEGMLGSSAGPGWLAANLPVEPYTGDAQ